MPGLKPVFGGGGFNEGAPWAEDSKIPELFETLKEGGCNVIDTAALYGTSEETLGRNKAGDQFVLDTKTKAGFGGDGYATKENIVKEGTNSKNMLKTTVDIYYLHAPDPATPLEQTLEGINEVYKSGFFKRFGVSNFKPEDVEKAYKICKEKGYPLPSVYQGTATRARALNDASC
jgi:aflatoxin B1 aldehyde reductase